MIQKRTKIVATVGPSCSDLNTLTQLAEAGANVLRLNFSHGTHQFHKEILDMIQVINQEKGYNLCVLQDLQGPKIRFGKIAGEGVLLKAGQRLVISTTETVGTSDKVSTQYQHIASDVNVGDTILVDDGKIELKTIDIQNGEVITKVIYGGMLKSNKGINLPDTNISIPCLTEKDEKDLAFGLKHQVDWVALSFVRKPDDIIDIKSRIKQAGSKTKVIAKIEKPEALKHIDSIIQEVDGIMVARGDLGVEIPMPEVPIWQKIIVKKCNVAAKPVIIATQMMESMIESPRPTRAETNDVANAVLDGADALMLSAETASGQFPVQVLQKMVEIIGTIEKSTDSIYNTYENKSMCTSTRMNDLLIEASCRLAEGVQAKAILCMTKSGYSGFKVAKHRSKANIYLFTSDKKLLKQMNLVWGVKTFYFDTHHSIDDTFGEIENQMVKQKLLQKGDAVVCVASMPQHWEGHSNMMKVKVVE